MDTGFANSVVIGAVALWASEALLKKDMLEPNKITSQNKYQTNFYNEDEMDKRRWHLG